ncbi:MAG: TIGR02147 family protein [Bdellovibrionota bacterium]
MQTSTSHSVFEYTDYRHFLRDTYRDRKKKNPRWSYGAWARGLGVRSPSTLVMIVQGERNPGDSLTERLVHNLNLSEKESRYFHDLVRLQKTKNDMQTSIMLVERLASQHHTGKFALLDLQTFSAISSWYYHAIRELVSLKGFMEDAHWIARQLEFRVPIHDIRRAIKVLLKLGLLRRDKKGKLFAGDPHAETPSDIASQGIRRFHEQSLKNAALSLQSCPVSDREFRGTTVAIPSSKIELAKKLIRKFNDEFCDALESSDSDRIYHLEIAFFPVVRIKEEA